MDKGVFLALLKTEMGKICAKCIRYNSRIKSSFWRKPILMKRTAIIATFFLIVASSAQPIPATALSNYTEAYKKAFRQESVLRMDFPQTVRVSF